MNDKPPETTREGEQSGRGANLNIVGVDTLTNRKEEIEPLMGSFLKKGKESDWNANAYQQREWTLYPIEGVGDDHIVILKYSLGRKEKGKIRIRPWNYVLKEENYLSLKDINDRIYSFKAITGETNCVLMKKINNYLQREYTAVVDSEYEYPDINADGFNGPNDDNNWCDPKNGGSKKHKKHKKHKKSNKKRKSRRRKSRRRRSKKP